MTPLDKGVMDIEIRGHHAGRLRRDEIPYAASADLDGIGMRLALPVSYADLRQIELITHDMKPKDQCDASIPPGPNIDTTRSED